MSSAPTSTLMRGHKEFDCLWGWEINDVDDGAMLTSQPLTVSYLYVFLVGAMSTMKQCFTQKKTIEDTESECKEPESIVEDTWML